VQFGWREGVKEVGGGGSEFAGGGGGGGAIKGSRL